MVMGEHGGEPSPSENFAMEMMDIHRAGVHGQQLGGVGGEVNDGGAVRDGGGGGAVHDGEGFTHGEGGAKWKTQALSEWSRSSSHLQEIPHPVLQGGCSQEDFNIFRR